MAQVDQGARPPRFPSEFEEGALQLLALPGQEALRGAGDVAPFMFFVRQRLKLHCGHAAPVGLEVAAQPCDPAWHPQVVKDAEVEEEESRVEEVGGRENEHGGELMRPHGLHAAVRI